MTTAHSAFYGTTLPPARQARETPKWPPAVRRAAEALKRHLEPQGVRLADYEAAAFIAGAAYAKSSRQQPKHLAESTNRIARMAVGERITFPPGTARAALYARMKQARTHLLKNPAAVWTCARLPSGELEVERVPDGTTHLRVRSDLTRALVGMAVGESIIVSDRKSTTISPNADTARRLLGQPTAAWRRKITSKGIRITRTA